jgi:hypothetical protein
MLLSFVPRVWSIAAADPAGKPVHSRAAVLPTGIVDAVKKSRRLASLCKIAIAPPAGETLD